MRILHVTSFVGPSGAAGGPVRVAISQLTELQDRGHEVLLVGGQIGYGTSPSDIDGVPVQLFPTSRVIPKSGFAGLLSGRLLKWLRENAGGFDIVHIHLGRDLTTLPAARMMISMGIPYVAQTHGMIDASSRLLAAPLDSLLTRVALKRAFRVLCLSQREVDDVVSVARQSLPVTVIPNGISTVAVSRERDVGESADVLFLARLHSRKRPYLFAQMAAELAKRYPGVTFSLVGPDEGEAPAIVSLVRSEKLESRIKLEGALSPDRVLARMAQSTIYVLPAVNEPFGLTVLEAMAAGLPVVIDETAYLSEMISRTFSGTVFDGTLTSLVSVVSSYLDNPALRSEHGTNGMREVARDFAIGGSVDLLEGVYIEMSTGR